MFAITSSDVTPQITPCSLHRFVDDLCSVCLLIKGRKSKEVSATTVAAQVEFLDISWTLFFSPELDFSYQLLLLEKGISAMNDL